MIVLQKFQFIVSFSFKVCHCSRIFMCVSRYEYIIELALYKILFCRVIYFYQAAGIYFHNISDGYLIILRNWKTRSEVLLNIDKRSRRTQTEIFWQSVLPKQAATNLYALLDLVGAKEAKIYVYKMDHKSQIYGRYSECTSTVSVGVLYKQNDVVLHIVKQQPTYCIRIQNE